MQHSARVLPLCSLKCNRRLDIGPNVQDATTPSDLHDFINMQTSQGGVLLLPTTIAHPSTSWQEPTTVAHLTPSPSEFWIHVILAIATPNSCLLGHAAEQLASYQSR
jgi:hypothetical protein|uniref:Uncharacterized protein n=1 Tax=Bionectria ochroleuca TaxID=29856 RepID=A0A8H7N4K8_BIOOC